MNVCVYIYIYTHTHTYSYIYTCYIDKGGMEFTRTPLFAENKELQMYC